MKLSKVQKKIIEYDNGPIRIIAGPGSGKTRTLISKIAYLVKEKGVNQSKILAITFTNKAATEMKERLTKEIGENKVKIMTYHGFCSYFLRIESVNLNMDKNYKILDMADKRSMITKLKNQFYSLKKISFYGINEMFDVYMHNEEKYLLDSKKGSPNYEFCLLLDAYNKQKVSESSIDFNDLLILTAKALEENSEIANKWKGFYEYIFIDEFQDTDNFQFKIIKELTTPNSNLIVVGDPDQNIYSWRGANLEIILNFKSWYPKTKDFHLSENYRSTQKIVNASKRLISWNRERIKIKLFTNNESGDDISVLSHSSTNSEALYVAKKISMYIKNGIAPNEIAVIYRTNRESQYLEIALQKYDIKYKIIGGFRFFDRKEIKEIFDFIDFLYNRKNSSLEKIINLPSKGVGPKTYQKFADEALENMETVYQLLKRKKLLKFENFINSTEEIIKHLESKKFIDKFIEYLKNIGYYDMYRMEKERIDQIENLLKMISENIENSDSVEDSIYQFKQEVALTSSQDVNANEKEITLMTAHASKGTEYDVVFIIGFKNGSFPHYMSENIEEERRLAYVSMTRAKKHLHLSYYQNLSNMYQSESRFIIESKLKIDNYNLNSKEIDSLLDVPQGFTNDIVPKVGNKIFHTTFANGIVKEVREFTIVVQFDNFGEKELSIGHKSVFVSNDS